MTKSLKTSKPLLFIAFVVLAMWFVSCRTVHAQSNDLNSVNEAISNLVATTTELQKQLAAAKAQLTPTNAAVIYYDKDGKPIATNTPAASVKITPDNITAWIGAAVGIISSIGGLLGAIVLAARALRKLIPDKAQVNGFGLALSNLSGEINPSIAKLSQAAADKPIPAKPPIV